MTSKTLYLLVTCSMDESRASLAWDVCCNLEQQNQNYPFSKDLLVFDNASKFTDHFKVLSKGAKLVQSDRNVGYWSAIHWTLNNYKKLFDRDYDYLYIIESDLIHKDMQKLEICERFLELNPQVGGVRTQEFSVRFRKLYDKQFHWLPFAKKHSLVAQKNAITGENVWFKKDTLHEGIYLTNFHAKLPALNRIKSLNKVFAALSERSQITEIDFMNLYYREHGLIGLLDGGLYRMKSTALSHHMSGSYSNASQLQEAGYLNTRIDRIVKSNFKVEIVTS